MANEGQLKPDVDGNARLGSDCVWLLRSCVELKGETNTQKLFEICKKECADTYYIQTKDDLDLSVLQSISNVGITAGASTPNKIIEEVQKKCQK